MHETVSKTTEAKLSVLFSTAAVLYDENCQCHIVCFFFIILVVIIVVVFTFSNNLFYVFSVFLGFPRVKALQTLQMPSICPIIAPRKTLQRGEIHSLTELSCWAMFRKSLLRGEVQRTIN